MNNKKCIKITFFIIFLINVSLNWAGSRNLDFKVLSSSDAGCTVDLSPIHFQIDTLVINETKYNRINFDMVGPSGEPGDPLIPCRTFVTGIPLDGGVKVTVTTSDFSEKQGIRLIPVPLLKEKDRLPVEIYKEGEAYKKSGFLPGVLYEAEEPAFFGEQRIVRITVFPVQFNPMENRIRLYTKIVLRIDFEGRGDTVQDLEKIRTRRENLYRKSLINFSEAKKWRLRRKKRLKKVSKVFETGAWYKIPVSDEKEGIFKVSGSFLKNNGIDISSIQPSTLKIYNNGGRELPRKLNITRADSLIENPIILTGMEDDRFDESDYFLFYGKGVRNWEYDASSNQYNHYINIYTNQNIYWLTFNDGIQGKRIRTVSPLSEQGSHPLNSFRDRFFLEQEIYNPLAGGIHWLGFQFSDQTPNESYSLTFSDPVSDDSLRFRFRFAGATNVTHKSEIRLNDQLLKKVSFGGSSGFVGIRFTNYSMNLYVPNLSSNAELSFQYEGPGIAPTAYLDWFEVEYERKLKASGSKLRFFSPSETGYYTYTLTGFSIEPLVLDVTDIADVRRMQIRSVSGGWNFTDSVTAEGPRFYQAYETSGYLTPEGIEKDQVSDLRNPDNSAELVIITHKNFYEQALRLKTLREEHDSLSVFIAEIQDVYDEFSWGLFDPTAIRDFMKHACENWTVCPSYLLLFGDGDYDYRNIRSDRDKNWIPPFERDGTTKESNSRATDDWFTYVIGDDSQMDLAIGRLPVQSEQEAKIVVDKIVQYETNPDLDEWRSIVTMVGDDEKGEAGKEENLRHTDALESIVNNLPSLFNSRKIYLTEYPEVTVVDGRRKPQANDDLAEQINKGTLLVNYIGHANEDVWAHEQIFVVDRDLPRLHNENKLPLFYAATCAFALYDNPDKQSFSEQLLNSEGKGAIAVIAASRFCNANDNEALNKKFMNTLFDDTGPTERIGNALRIAKLNYTANNEMYNILGDPAMRLGIPRYRAVFTKMEPNTFKALSVIKVEGKVEKDGAEWTDFSGKIALKGFDSKKNIEYKTQGGYTLDYTLPGNALFRGEAKVQNGQFQFSFVVPKDISYGGQTGRLSCYFWNQETDGAGYRDLIKVGGSADLVDNQGPEIELYFTEQENFVTGEMVPEEPELVAAIQDDKSGINITGEIGHKIIMTIDQEKQDVTEHFQYDEGSHLQGKLLYRLTGIKTGEHELSIKAWDNANNSATQYLNFNVVVKGDLIIEDVLNYPNPFSTSTSFTFQINQNARIEIKVFTVSGRLIKHLDDYWAEAGFNMIPWDGRDIEGDELANGVYIYKFNAISNINGIEVKKSIIERLMVMH